MTSIVDFPVKPEARPYLDAFAENTGEAKWLRAARRRGLSRFAEIGFPGRKSESWRYLDLQPLLRRPLLPANSARRADLGQARDLLGHLALPGDCPRLVLVDGRFVPDVSTLEMPDGIWFGPISTAITNREHLLREMAEQTAEDPAHPLAALNAAFFGDGYILDVDPGVALDQPIEIIHLAAAGDAGSYHTRSLIRLDAGSRADILEVYAGDGRYWRNDVVTARLAEGAALRRAVVVEEGADAVHLAQFDASLGRKASFTGFALLLSGKTVRHEANIALRGDGAHCQLDGAFVVSGSDEANIVTAVEHCALGGQTRELIKGVAANRGHGAFQGRIKVHEHAQQTDAHQLSRNLVIGSRAAIDTKPELEIYADDVKCSHGASVGDLDEAALFYLRARGIPEAEARRMLIDGFLREAVETVDDFASRTYLLRRLAARLAKLEE